MVQKFQYNSNKNGYLQIDFLFVLLIIMFFYTFYLFSIHDDVEVLKNQMKYLELELESKTICELLVSQPGLPKNWESATPTLIGLKNSSLNGLSQTKIDVFFTTSNYATYHSLFETNSLLEFELKYFNGTVLNSVGFYDSSSTLESYSECYSFLGNELVRLGVRVWR